MIPNQNQHLETLSEIRNLMERSSRFISLSGLSGVIAGIFALLGAAMVYAYLDIIPFSGTYTEHLRGGNIGKWGIDYATFFILDALMVLICALAGGIFFTTRKARKKGQKIWDKLTLRLLINLAIPLAAGGIFCLALLNFGALGLVAPATLIFYGLSLVNASKYTLDDIRNLGLVEIVLGLIASFNIGYGLEFWTIGFGLMHILYGTLMYYKYER